MKSVLQQLYDGELFPAEQYSPKIEEYQRLLQEHNRCYDDFFQKLAGLDPDLCETFVKLQDDSLNFVPYETSEMFIQGFRLGARMMIEIFQEDFSNRNLTN